MRVNLGKIEAHAKNYKNLSYKKCLKQFNITNLRKKFAFNVMKEEATKLSDVKSLLVLQNLSIARKSGNISHIQKVFFV